MNVMTRVPALVLLAAAVLTGVALAQGPAGGRGFPRDARQQPTATGTSVIRGRVVAADIGGPDSPRPGPCVFDRHARLAPGEHGRTRPIRVPRSPGRTLGADGVEGGVRHVAASGSGGRSRLGTPVELRDAQVVERADIALPRGAAITGRVFDEFGDPVAGARLQVLRYQLVQGTRRLTPTGVGDQSDDTGAFRLFGLTPGDYYVSATVRALPVDDPTVDAAGYAPTYYPGTGNVAEAQRVTLGLGQELTNVSFALLPVRTVRVIGQRRRLDGAATRRRRRDAGAGRCDSRHADDVRRRRQRAAGRHLHADQRRARVLHVDRRLESRLDDAAGAAATVRARSHRSRLPSATRMSPAFTS